MLAAIVFFSILLLLTLNLLETYFNFFKDKSILFLTLIFLAFYFGGIGFGFCLNAFNFNRPPKLSDHILLQY